MNQSEALKEIIKVIDSYLSENPNESYERFYIGKTDNFEERYNQHCNREEFPEIGMHNVNAYNEMYELAKSDDCEKINNLEKAVISHYKGHSALDNQNNGGGGNPYATSLYVAFWMTYNGDKDREIDTIHNDVVPIENGFPIEVKD